MSQNELFSRTYDVDPEMLMDFLQQAMAAIPTVTSFKLADSGDRIDFVTSITLTSWGENMVASVAGDGRGGSVLHVSGEPRVGLASTPWGEEIHAATIESQLFAALDPSIELTRTNPMVMLQADHRRVEALFVRIRAAADDGERAELVQQLVRALRIHMELEEQHVYPLLGKEVDGDLAEEAEVEHQLARDTLARLEELTPDEPGFDGALTMVMAGIEHHVVEEEAEAFPRLAAQLGPDRLAELAQELMGVRAELLGREHGSNGSKSGRSGGSSGSRSTRRRRRAIDPDETTKADLVDRAKKAGVSGYSHMTKAELADALSSAAR